MSFTIPNLGDAGWPDQAEPDSQDFRVVTDASGLTGVVTGCAVTAQGSPDMTVAVAVGAILTNGAYKAVSSGNVTISAADGTNPRFDLIVADSTGAKQRRGGTAAANPVFPAPSAGDVVLAAVYVPASDTAINTNQITDKRITVQAVGGASVYRAADTNLADSSLVAWDWDSEEFDDAGFHEGVTNPSRFTVPTGYGGLYLVTASVQFTAHATGRRYVDILKGGAIGYSIANFPGSAAAGGVGNGSAVMRLADTNYVQVRLYQDSGTTNSIIAAGSRFSIARISA